MRYLMFQVFPTLYFRAASGNIMKYDRDRTKQHIIEFIEKNRTKHAQLESFKDGTVISNSAKEKAMKNEL